MDVDLLENRGLHPDLGTDRADIARRRLDGLLHHLAQLAGRLHPPLAGQFQRLDRQKVAADGCPGEARDHADLVLLLGQAIAELLHAEEVLKVLRRDLDPFGILADDLRQRLARDLRNLALKVPHPGLAGIGAHHFLKRLIGQLELGLLQTVVLHLLRDQVLPRDLALFVLGVPGQRNDLHPVQKRAGHVVGVRGGQEHHVRQVVFDLKVMVHEGRVLLRVQHLKHGACRVAPEILPHLVDLIEQDQRIGGLRLLQRLDDLAGHGADIGPPVATDLAFIPDTAKRDADELAPRRLRDRFAKRGLADARRADKTEDRAFHLLAALLHGQIFDDPFLDLFQTIVIVIKDFLGFPQVLLDAGLDAPGQAEKPVEVVANHRRLGRHRRHGLELFQLRLGLVARFLGEFGVLDLLGQFVDLVLAVLAVAQFLLNSLHLLIQVVFALGALHLGLHAGLDLLLDLKDGHFALHQAKDLLKPLGDIQRFQKRLLLANVDAKVAGHKVGQLGRFLRLGDGRQRLLRDVLLDLGVTLELLGDRPQKRLDSVLVTRKLGQRLRLGLEIGLVLDEIGDAHAHLALHQHLHGAVGQFQQLQHIGQHARAIDAIGRRVVHRRVDLGRQQDLAILAHHFLKRPHGFLAPDEQRHDHVGKDHDVAQRQDRVAVGEFFCHSRSFGSARPHRPRTSAAIGGLRSGTLSRRSGGCLQPYRPGCGRATIVARRRGARVDLPPPRKADHRQISPYPAAQDTACEAVLAFSFSLALRMRCLMAPSVTPSRPAISFKSSP